MSVQEKVDAPDGKARGREGGVLHTLFSGAVVLAWLYNRSGGSISLVIYCLRKVDSFI